MSLNFDAKISLDVSQFLASVKTAENAVASLNQKISNLNNKKATSSVSSPSTTAVDVEIQSRRSAARAVSEQESATKALGITERNNAKVEWQSEMMRKKAIDASIKDHQTISSLYDTTIKQRDRESKTFANSLRAELNGREAMNKLHGQALAINQRYDAARAAGSAASIRTMARERYALYDVAAAYQQVERIAVGALKAMIGTAAQYEREFANVTRTTEFVSVKAGEAARVMKVALTDLATQIPVSFKSITEIATIGNQLGIAQGNIVGFTKSIAQFSTITGVTVDNAAMSFGRVGELLNEKDYNKIGSAIAYAGVKAVATEAQILSVTKEIATTARMAKFSTPDVVGLATALSSLGIAPEAARGSIIRTFAGINQAVGAGGAELKKYADISGMTAEEFAKKWKTNGQDAFNSFLKGLQKMSDSGSSLDSVLRGIGIHNVRDIQTIQKLGDNYDVYSSSIANANKGFSEGTFLATAYGIVQQTVASKLEIVKNQWDNLMAAFGDVNTGGFKVLLDTISAVIKSLTQFANNPVGKVIVQITTVALGLVTAISAVNAIVALSKASFLAFATAMNTAAESEVLAGEAGNVAALGFNKAKIAAVALNTTLKAAGWLAIIMAAVEAANMLGDAFQQSFDKAGYSIRKAEDLLGSFTGLQDALTADNTAAMERYGNKSAVAAAIASGALDGVTTSAQTNNDALKAAEQQASGLATIVGGQLTSAIDGTTVSLEKQNIVLGANYDAWLKNQILQSTSFQDAAKSQNFIEYLNKVGYSFEAANKAAKAGKLDQYFADLEEKGRQLSLTLPAVLKSDWWNGFNFPLQQLKDAFAGATGEAYLLGNGVTTATNAITDLGKAPDEFIKKTIDAGKAFTIWDYISQVQAKMKTAFDWQFEATIAADKVKKSWNDVRKTFEDAKKSVSDLNTEMNKLVSNKQILEYQLSIATKYGDTLRANQLQAELADANAKIAENAAKAADAQASMSGNLTGNSDAAIQNRQTLRDLTTGTIDWLTTMKTSGKTTAQMISATKDQKKAFIDQAVAMGFSKTQLKDYTDMFDNYITVLKNTPDKLDLSMNVYAKMDAADAALQKWKNDNKSATIEILIKNPEYQAWLQQKNYDALSTGNKNYVDRAVAMYSTTMNKMDEYKASGNKTAFNKSLGEMLKWIAAADKKKSGLGNIIVSQSGLEDIRNIQKMASGGFISGAGSGTSDSVPIMGSHGEFMIQASAVRAYGVDFLNAINQQQIPTARSMSMPAPASSGSQVVYLSPDDRQLLRAALDRPVTLYTENTKIAQSANAGNVILAQRGSN